MNRQFWRDIVNNKYQLPANETIVGLTNQLLRFLAEPNSELRESFGYDILARWIIVYRYHSEEDLREITKILLQQLAAGLGEGESDGVFLRSSAAGILALIIYRDTQSSFLDAIDIKTIAADAGTYLVQERDHRAYVPDKGWANACGNTADLLRYLAYNTSLDAPHLLQMLNCIAEKVLQVSGNRFEHDEDDRLAKAALAIMSRSELTIPEINEWLTHFLIWSDEHRPEKDAYDPSYHQVYQNVKRFLRALLVQIRVAPRLASNLHQLETDIVAAVRVFSL